MKNYKITSMIIAIFITALIISCSKGSIATIPATGNMLLKAKATITNTSTAAPTANLITATNNSSSTKGSSSFTISSIKINIKNIELSVNEKEGDLINPSDSIYKDLELKGPFLLDLASGNTSIDIANTTIPNNVYDKVKFELNKSTDSSSTISGKSIEIKGNINGVPFVFWTDAEKEMEIKFLTSTTNIVVNGNTNTTTINFDLSAIFGNTSALDFSTAVDGNGDGIIEISPNNVDGNAKLADSIKNLLEEGADLEKD